jgi:hypothetical protein
VLLFRAASGAEELRTLPALDQALASLARSLARPTTALRPEAERLAALCEQGPERTRRKVSAARASQRAERIVACPERTPA